MIVELGKKLGANTASDQPSAQSKDLLPFHSDYQPPERTSFRTAVNRAFFSEFVSLHQERRAVLGWEKAVQLREGLIIRQDEQLDAIERMESVLRQLRRNILSGIEESS